ncbi:hypothetical protein [Seonamhaeicola marinus]|uniref:Uncharacterized protein n=1 Tax=Seonamhaeicola marinus TaxID=1912246 RepID=A0A5D0IM97_9FLAO|nr:hypothetical protein [Seonamhaeicola marinus]TYA84149.1 hypothetical protein FUA24_05715 [Seonamhaeicola marinus]
MGGGGAMMSAIASLKNNRNLLSKKGKLKNTLSGSKNKDKLVLKVSETSPHQLKLIREKVIQENKRIRNKRLVAISIIMAIVIAVFLYYV